MAVSRDVRQYNFPPAVCFQTWLNFLPLAYVRIEPFVSAPLLIESQNFEAGEIKAIAQISDTSQPFQTSTTSYYRFRILCQLQPDQACRVQVEAATGGVTDVGLGQLLVRQLLMTLSLALNGKMPPGTLPIFLLQLPKPPPTSPQATFETIVNKAFTLSRRGQADDALATFQQALSLNPVSADVHFHVGVLLLLLGYLPEAANAFSACLHYDQHHLLAAAYLEDVRGRWQRKQTTATEAATLVPASPTPTPNSLAAIIPVKPIKGVMAKLAIRSADGSRREYQLARQVVTLGRQETCDVVLADVRVSRRHTEISSNDQNYYVTDLGSANGTLLNSQRLQPHQLTLLQNGDVLSLGDSEITFTSQPIV